MVCVRVFTTLQRLVGGQRRLRCELPTGSMVLHLLQVLDFPYEEVGLIAKNGEMVSVNSLLADGDQVDLAGYLEGG